MDTTFRMRSEILSRKIHQKLFLAECFALFCMGPSIYLYLRCSWYHWMISMQGATALCVHLKKYTSLSFALFFAVYLFIMGYSGRSDTGLQTTYTETYRTCVRTVIIHPVCVLCLKCYLVFDRLLRQLAQPLLQHAAMPRSPTRGGVRPGTVPYTARLWNESDARRISPAALLIPHTAKNVFVFVSSACCGLFFCNFESLEASRALARVRRIV